MRTISPPSLAILVLMAGVSVLTLNIFQPAMNDMAAYFDVDYGTMSITLWGYVLITGLFMLIFGPLSDRFGRRPVALVCISILILSAVGAALAPTFEVFILFRIFQACAVGAATIGFASIRDTATSANEATKKMASVAMIMAISPLIGPLIGGLLTHYFGWQANLWFLASLGLIIFIVAWFDFGETNVHKSKTFGTQLRSYPPLLASAKFWGYALCLNLSVGVFFVFLTGMPVVGAEHFDLGSRAIGFYLGLLTAGYIVANAITRVIATRYRLSTLMVGGRLLGLFGPVSALILWSLFPSLPLLAYAPLVLLGAANGFAIQAANGGALSVFPKLAGSASGLSGALGGWVGGGMSAMAGYILTASPSPLTFGFVLLFAACLPLIPAFFVLVLDRREAAAEQAAKGAN